MKATNKSLLAVTAASAVSQVAAFGVSIKSAPIRNSDAHVMSMSAPQPSRRSFLSQAAISSGLVGTASSLGFFLNFDQQGLLQHGAGCQCGYCDAHDAGCQCGSCSGVEGGQHGAGCQCGQCLTEAKNHPLACNCGSCLRMGPSAAFAYERDVGDDSRSPETDAFNRQVRR